MKTIVFLRQKPYPRLYNHALAERQFLYDSYGYSVTYIDQQNALPLLKKLVARSVQLFTIYNEQGRIGPAFLFQDLRYLLYLLTREPFLKGCHIPWQPLLVLRN